MVPLIIILLTAHHMLVFTLCNVTLWFNMEFSVDHYLLFWEFTYWQRWNQVSLLNRRNVGSFFRIQSTKVPVHKIEVCFMMCPRVCELQLFHGSNADGIYRHDSLTVGGGWLWLGSWWVGQVVENEGPNRQWLVVLYMQNNFPVHFHFLVDTWYIIACRCFLSLLHWA